jgi:hypothetical protein
MSYFVKVENAIKSQLQHQKVSIFCKFLLLLFLSAL